MNSNHYTNGYLWQLQKKIFRKAITKVYKRVGAIKVRVPFTGHISKCTSVKSARIYIFLKIAFKIYRGLVLY